jgi:hypothetical protein
MFEHNRLQAEAVVLAEEGYGMVLETDMHGVRWEHRKYILEVRPAGQQPFRVETKAKIAIFHQPSRGDSVTVSYDSKSHKTEIHIEGDARYDPKLIREATKKKQAAQREALLSGAPLAPVASGSADAALRHNREAARERADNALYWRLPPACPECGAKVDPAMASQAEHPQCGYCGSSLPSNRLHLGEY